MAYMKSTTPPNMLKYQNETGITLFLAFSECIHWTINLMLKHIWPNKPKITHGFKRSLKFIIASFRVASVADT